MVRTVTTALLSLQTDLTSSPPINSCGILHGSTPTQQIFCWILDASHLNVASDHLIHNIGCIEETLVFIPYSSKDNWNSAYSFAIPSLECSASGQMKLLSPQSLKGPTNDTSKSPTTSPIKYPQLKQRKSGRKAGIELLSSSKLTNAERDVLHIEMYKYLTWLRVALEEVEVVHAGKRTLGNAPATSSSVGEVVEAMDRAFKVVGVNTDHACVAGKSPLLERCLGKELAKLVVAAPLRGASHKRELGEFENYWARLMEFKEKHGHSNGKYYMCFIKHKFPVRYKEDLKLGKWISNIRQKRKSLDSQGLDECKPTKKGRGSNQTGAVTLTKERIDRFNSINFSWDLTGSTPRLSWDIRFNQMMDYYRKNGRWPPHSQGTLGEWVHKQRCKWAKREPAFMEKHYHKLEEVGFLWKVKDRQTAPWETRIEQLKEFGRLNGHFHVPNPDCDDRRYLEESYVEATRFYKWVNSLQTEYELFKSGGCSKILDDDRVLQLVKLGFQFGGGGVLGSL